MSKSLGNIYNLAEIKAMGYDPLVLRYALLSVPHRTKLNFTAHSLDDAKAALERQESRGGHTRDDFPGPNEEWGTKNLVLSLNSTGDGVDLAHQPLPVMPDELKTFFEAP